MSYPNILQLSKEELNRKGVYLISSLDDSKVYIGSTFHNQGFNRRLHEHFRLLRKNKHHSKILQNHFNKYGEESLKVSILEFVNNKSILTEREQYWIDFYKSQKKILLNISTKASHPYGIDFSFRHKKVYRFSLDGMLLKEWNSVKEAEQEIGCKKGTISSAIGKSMKTYKGFVYQKDIEFKPLTYKKNKTYSKRIKCLNDEREFNSLTEAANFYNIIVSTISDNLRKNLNNKKGLRFEYL